MHLVLSVAGLDQILSERVTVMGLCCQTLCILGLRNHRLDVACRFQCPALSLVSPMSFHKGHI